jgi:23S rRNA (guanosine2251-2'-O)-methyltransferase
MTMPGNSQRKGAGRRKGNGGAPAGSGGRGKRGLEGKGPTPKAEDRPYHKAYRAKQQRSTTQRPANSGPARKRGAGAEWIAGRNPVLEALRAELPIENVYVAAGAEDDDRLNDIFKITADRGTTILQTTRTELDKMTGGATHQGVAIRLPAFRYHHPDDLLTDTGPASLIVALDQVTDPHNLGAVIRSAAAFGANGVVIPQRRSAQLTAAAWKSSAGAAARLPVARAANLNRTLTSYRDAGLFVVGLAGDGDTDIAALAQAAEPLVLAVGSEGAGLSRLARQSCDVLASIPIASAVESLNASVAAGVALYEVTRLRNR